ncbi:MAG TPA: MalM family protein [Steroidobacteraceae bacterium]|nr:MalM family protein [Steroidobacteraceae bacterium]
MRNPTTALATVAAMLLAGCAAPSATSYPAAADVRLATYAKATPCCDDPSGFRFSALPKQGSADAVVDAASPVFDFQSGVSPFAAFVLPDAKAPYRVRVKSLFDPKAGDKSTIFYPVVALMDDAFIVVHLTGLESLRLEPALATVGGESGLAVSFGVDPVDQKGKYLVVFTPAALLGKPPPGDREGDMLSLSSLAWMERHGETAVPASPYGKIQVTIAPELAMAGAEKEKPGPDF